ncbi:acyl-CoA dehydrogenase/oxidase [Bisporella sp. PMI_857]|nr:acyl-CoA dehydrogenase/oxidase [Bisporella sp. PMI_857]
MIDFSLSAEQNAIRSMASTFATSILLNASSTYENHPTQKQRFQALRPFYAQAVSFGLIKGLIPRSLGGLGGTILDSALLVEELYKTDRSLSLTIFATGLGLSPLLIGGTAEQHEEFLRPFLSGEGEPLASLVHSEPTGTANWLEQGGKGLQATARKEGEEWVVNGEKMWPTNCSGWDDRGADLQCLVCRFAQNGEEQDPDADPADSILILLVTREVVARNKESAYQVLSHFETAGHTSTAGPHTRFTEFRVPDHNLLAAPGKGAQIVTQCFTATAALVGAMSVGIMAAAFEAALAFAKSDTRGGAEPIFGRQSVADLLMDVKMRIDAARFLTWKACHALDSGLGGELSLQAKIYCSDLAVKSVVDCMSAVGTSSYNKGSVFPRLLNDAMALPLFDGGNIGVRRRALEKIFAAKDYQPWAATYGAQ